MNRFVASLKSHPLGLVGIIIVTCITVLSIVGPSICPYDPNRIDLRNMFRPPLPFKGSEAAYPLGTDMLGRDVLSRLIFGTRSSIIVGILSSLIALVIGVSLGLLAGYLGGITNVSVMRLVDIMLAIPAVMLAILLVAMIGPQQVSIIIAMGLTMWTEYTKVIRSRILTLKEEPFILAAKAMGSSNIRIILTHILPHVLYIIIVIFTLQIGVIILWSAGLSFIGLGGVSISWGWDVAAGRAYLAKAWWLSTLPGTAIFITVIGCNLFGEWIRDFLDPSIQKVL